MTEEELFGFDFIVGYTSGGAPYGITMEDAEEQTDEEDLIHLRMICHFKMKSTE